jgi:sigma-E factor negative regulatory protein RseA
MKEKLSELMDNELNDLDSLRLVRAMDGDRELRGTWERYNLMRAAMHKELSVVVSPDLADRIALTIAQEPPAHAVGISGTWRRPRLATLAAGMSIAASVAAVAIFTLQPLSINNGTQAPLVAQKAGSTSVSPTLVAKNSRPARQGTLNSYLVEHSEFGPSAGMNGMMSYVRIVGYSDGKPQNGDK